MSFPDYEAAWNFLFGSIDSDLPVEFDHFFDKAISIALGDNVLYEIDRDIFYNLIGMEPTSLGAIQEEWLVQVWPKDPE